MTKELRNMHCLDIYTMSLPIEEVMRSLANITPTRPRLPLNGVAPSAWMNAATHSAELRKLRSMQREFHWQVDLEHLVNRRYDAIVVTGTDRMIQWVSRGFRRMTGYAPEAVIGRKPSFLQGPLTDPDALQVLRDALQRSEPARIELVNYRSNGEAYRCVVSIEPLYNTQNEVTHFIAFEYATP